MGTYIDPKLATGAGLGPALAFVLWIVAYMVFGTVRQFARDEPMIFGLVITATGAVLGGLLGYLVPNASSPIKGELVGRVEPLSAADTAAMIAEHDRIAGRG